MKKILVGVSVVSLMGIGAYMMSPPDDGPALLEQGVIAEIKDLGPRLAGSFDGIGDVLVRGACYSGTAGDDVFPPRDREEGDCIDMTSMGVDTAIFENEWDGIYARISNGSDIIDLRDNDAVLDVYGDFDFLVERGGGQISVVVQNRQMADIRLSIQGDDLILQSKRGRGVIRGNYSPEWPGGRTKTLVYEDYVIDADGIYNKAMAGQMSDGDDIIFGTAGDDVIYSGSGRDIINPGRGSDTIYHSGGYDEIRPDVENTGSSTLVLPITRAAARVSVLDSTDLSIEWAEGRVVVKLQMLFDLDDVRLPIKKFVFKDGVVVGQSLTVDARRR